LGRSPGRRSRGMGPASAVDVTVSERLLECRKVKF
jgi:hypothetical protein